MNRRILIVDDTEAIHASFETVLGGSGAQSAALDGDLDLLEAALFDEDPTPEPPAPRDLPAVEFELAHARQGREALEKVAEAVDREQPFALAFVDMRMPPGWDGMETIQRLWEVDPALQVCICTAYSDRSWGEIRQTLGTSDGLLILKKPFDPAEVAQVAVALTSKWNAARRNRELMEGTVTGAVEVMGEMLALGQPLAFERVAPCRAVVAHVADHLGLTHWAYDLAAALSCAGCVTLPGDLVQRALAGAELDPSDAGMFERHPRVGAELVRRIPGLECVADIVETQLVRSPWPAAPSESDPEGVVAIGRALLPLGLLVSDLLHRGTRPRQLSRLAREQGYEDVLCAALQAFHPPRTESAVASVTVDLLKVGMVFQEPVCTRAGQVICPMNTTLTLVLLERLKTFAERTGLREPMLVLVPKTGRLTAA